MKSAVESEEAAAIVAALGLAPHLREGGWFREIYRAAETLPAHARGGRHAGPRALAAAYPQFAGRIATVAAESA